MSEVEVCPEGRRALDGHKAEDGELVLCPSGNGGQGRGRGGRKGREMGQARSEVRGSRRVKMT